MDLSDLMNRFTFLLVFLLNAILVASTSAQETVASDDAETSPALDQSSMKVGFVDIEIAIGESQAIRKILGEIDEEMRKDGESIDSKKQEARRLRIMLERQGSVLSDEERQERQQQIIDLMAEIDELEYKFKRKIEQTERTTFMPLVEQVIRIVGDVGKNENFDLIVRGEMVLYGRARADLTPLVVEELDSRYEELREVMIPMGSKKPAEEKPEVLPMIP